jgi:lactate racemase
MIELPWGSDGIRLDIPEGWRLTGAFLPNRLPAVPDAGIEAVRSLRVPIGCDRLGEHVKRSARVVIVLDDSSHPAPVHCILPAVLSELAQLGISNDQITLIPAVSESKEQVAARTGISGLKIEIPSRDDPSRLDYLGMTTRGTPVFFHKTVARSDLVVSIGSIEPHIIAGFSGGYQTLITSTAGRATIAQNEALNYRPETFLNAGQPAEKNPMRLDHEEAGRMLKPQVFIIDSVLNTAGEVVQMVSGHPIDAQRAGAAVCASIYSVRIPAQADVVITTSHPADQDLRQGMRALANTLRALHPGGVMLCLLRAEMGAGAFGLAGRKMPLGNRMLKAAAPLILPLASKINLNGLGEEDRFYLYFALQALRTATLLVYAPTIPPEIQQRLPYFTFVSSPEEGLDLARRRFPGAADVIVFPQGGSTYPVLPAGT